MQSTTDTIWFNSGVGQSSQWAELYTVWMVVKNEAASLTICTDSWPVHKGLTLGFATLKTQQWLIGNRPCGNKPRGKIYGT